MSYATSSDKTIADRLEDLREDSSPSSLAPIVEHLPTEDSPVLFALSPDQIEEGLVHLDFSAFLNNSLSSKVSANTSTSGARVWGYTGAFASYSSLRYVIDISANAGNFIGLKGESFTLSLTNVWCCDGFLEGATLDFVNAEVDLDFLLDNASLYADGVPLSAEFKFNRGSRDGTIDFSFTLDEPLSTNVSKFSVIFDGSPSDFFGNVKYHFCYGIYLGNVLIQYTDSTNGFLASIIEWLRSIRDGVSGVISAIISLPGQIWDFIESGLIALFIPDQDQMIDFNNAMDELLADRLGALYQGTNMVVDFLMSLGTYEQQSTIRFPGLDMSDFGIPFVMEPQEVQIIPDAFDFIVDSIKFIVNVLATILFVNSLKRRLEKVFEGD